MSNPPPTSDLRSPTSSRDSENEVLVRVNGVSKKFCRDLKKSLWYGMKDVASELLPFSANKKLTPDSCSPTPEPALRAGEFWANKDISFELRRGECIGLIGRNGAGKTTLLKMLNGLIKPDSGTIEMRGRVGALIALGAGFNPILTGRENIYVNGSILGLSKEEIDAKMEDIIEFAEIRDFIDSPVQSYSSGMQVRLGFSVASSLTPDIIILDEVLAVGDTAFRAKCLKRISTMMDGIACIFVTHNMAQIGMICDETLVLEKGALYFKGPVSQGMERYVELNTPKISKSDPTVTVLEKPLLSLSLAFQEETDHRGAFDITVTARAEKDLVGCLMRIKFLSEDGQIAAEWNSDINEHAINIYESGIPLKITINNLNLLPGSYILAVVLHEPDGFAPLYISENYARVKVTGSCSRWVHNQLQ